MIFEYTRYKICFLHVYLFSTCTVYTSICINMSICYFYMKTCTCCMLFILCVSVCMSVCECVCVCMCVCVCVWHIHANTLMHTHTHIYIFMYLYILLHLCKYTHDVRIRSTHERMCTYSLCQDIAPRYIYRMSCQGHTAFVIYITFMGVHPRLPLIITN